MHVPKHEAADDGHQNEESNNDAEVERERVRVQSCKGVPQCVNGVRERIDINQRFHPAGQRSDGEKRAAQERERQGQEDHHHLKTLDALDLGREAHPQLAKTHGDKEHGHHDEGERSGKSQRA